MTKTGKRLTLALGVAAGATLAVFATGKTGKKAIQYVSRKSSEVKGKGKLRRERFDDSETFYV